MITQIDVKTEILFLRMVTHLFITRTWQTSSTVLLIIDDSV